MAVIGRYHAIATFGKWKLWGFLAWLVWSVVHLREITLFQNRLLVMMQWAWTFFTRRRFARLITGSEPFEERHQSSATID
jgi:NADH dehydrogenase